MTANTASGQLFDVNSRKFWECGYDYGNNRLWTNYSRVGSLPILCTHVHVTMPRYQCYRDYNYELQHYAKGIGEKRSWSRMLPLATGSNLVTYVHAALNKLRRRRF